MMRDLIVPCALKRGDTVAAVSLSWGGAGDPEILWRYEVGKKCLREVFGLHVVEMENTLKGTDYLYSHPEKRAEDLLSAFRDPAVRGIFSCIGGDDSVRLLPYLDESVIRSNPKVFLGYSDTTVIHLACLHAGLRTYYGPSILAEFAENFGVFPYTAQAVSDVLFSGEPQGEIAIPNEWTSERIPWLFENREIRKTMRPNDPPVVLQGKGTVRGRLIGGCIESIEMVKATSIWDAEDFTDAIVFFETSEEMPIPQSVLYWLRNYGAQGILQKIRGIVWGRPYDDRYRSEYVSVIYKALAEFDLPTLPVLYGLPFGHTEPMTTIPYGAMAELDCDRGCLSISEPGVVKD